MEEYIWVATREDLHHARETISSAEIISLDTEYDSFRYFRDKLCLIQLRAKGSTFLLDPLSDLDLSFLGDAFANPKVKIIAHAGDNDIRLLKRDYDFPFANVFDTHRAAMILGYEQLSLSRLVRYFLGVDLEKKKKLQRSRWDIRPLEEEQLQYAALDVFCLADLYGKLTELLGKQGLGNEACQAFDQICQVTWQEKTLDTRGHLRIKGYQELSSRERSRLKKLFQWRFQKAQERNRSFFMILSDETLLKLSRMEELTMSSVTARGLLPRDKTRELATELIQLLGDQSEAGQGDGHRKFSRPGAALAT